MVALLISLIMVIISQCIPGSKYQVVHFKCIQLPPVYYNLIKLKKIEIKVIVWEPYLTGPPRKLIYVFACHHSVSLWLLTNKNQYAA